MLAYGHQWPVGLQGGRNDLAPVFFAQRLTASDLRLLRSASVRYLLVDHRLARSLPVEGFYYNQDEPGVGVHRRPVPIAAFEKFDRLGAVSRVFDSGDIAIFDIGYLVRNE